MSSRTAVAERANPRQVYHRRTECRVCSERALQPFLSLGPMPLANAFLRGPDEFAAEPRFPLDVALCPNCSLVQLLDRIDPEVLFRHYLYQSGFSASYAAHNARLARLLVDRLSLAGTDLVVEIASNDGSLLKCFRAHGVRTLGIEPARNLARQARQDGLETLDVFFQSAIVPEIRAAYGTAKVVIANNVLAHVDEPCDFLRGCRELLAPGGLVVLEVPYLAELMDRLEYDTIYHEHLSYFSVTALLELCERAGLVLADIEQLPVHGGSLRIYAAREEDRQLPAPTVMALANQETRRGLTSLRRFQAFADGVRENRTQVMDLLRGIHATGRTVAGYGAPAKGNTLLNYCGIDSSLMPFVVDKNPLKVGLFTPGMHIPVLPVRALLERQPDFLLILPWNLADEIREQQRHYQQRGGAFILPIPEPKVL